MPAAAWNDEATALGIKPKYLRGIAEDTASQIEAHLPQAAEAVARQLDREDPLVASRTAIAKGIRGIRRGLRAR